MPPATLLGSKHAWAYTVEAGTGEARVNKTAGFPEESAVQLALQGQLAGWLLQVAGPLVLVPHKDPMGTVTPVRSPG